MKKLNINYKPRYLILGLLIFVACVFFIRCYYHEPSGDEILYQYLWEDDDPTLLWDVNHKFIRKAHNLKDIIHFQVRHYKEINGRSFVHTIEQLFTDNFLLFSIVNTGVFVLFTFLCKRFVTDGGKGSYLLWLSIVCSLLFLFPYEKSLWTSINYGPNYLWPATAAVGVLILWNILDTRTISFKFIPLVTMLAIASGWSHEAFAVGLSGGMFLYYCSHLRKFKGQVLWLVLPYWISTTFMVFAPGNLIRFSGSTSVGSVSLLPKIFNGLDNVTQLTTFWLFWLGVVVIILFRRNTAITFAKNNVKLLCVLITSMVFSIIINMMPYSHTFCVLVALLVMIKYLWDYPLSFKGVRRKVVMSLITILFFLQQLILARDTIKLYEFEHSLMEEYISSKDGVVLLDQPFIFPTSVNYIRGGDPTVWFKSITTNTIQGVYGEAKKEANFLYPPDYNAIKSPGEYFISQNKFVGDAPAYQADGSYYCWINPAEITEGMEYEAKMYPYDFFVKGTVYERLFYLVHPEENPTPIKLNVDTIHSVYGDAYRLKLPKISKVKEINKRDYSSGINR